MESATTGTRREEASWVQAIGAAKRFGEPPRAIDAVAEISFAVARGELVSILGPSGCGKSTLLMMVAGLETPTRGWIEIAGERITGPSGRNGIVFQDANLLPWRSVLENVLFPLEVLRRPRAEAKARAAELLALVGLEEFADRRPRELSGGMRQRAALARALVHEPQILLMDEPFSALDAITRDEMGLCLAGVWQAFRPTTLFVTHSIREAVFLSDRVLVLSARPARLLESVPVPFARPRPVELGETPEFNALCGHLRRLLAGARTAALS